MSAWIFDHIQSHFPKDPEDIRLACHIIVIIDSDAFVHRLSIQPVCFIVVEVTSQSLWYLSISYHPLINYLSAWKGSRYLYAVGIGVHSCRIIYDY